MQYNTMIIKYLSYFLFLVYNGFPFYGEASPHTCLTYPVGIHGTCVAMEDCSRLQDLLNKTRRKQGNFIETLKQSLCTKEPTVTVCCEPPPPEPYVLPTGCGKGSLQKFIVGGEDSGWWPWIVLLIAKGNPFCGGTLIHESFVLTAAHCITPRFILETVRVGELNIATNTDTWKGKTAPPVQEVKVADVIKHPHYEQGGAKVNDLAILRLEHPVEINNYVSSICLPLNLEKFYLEKQMGDHVSDFEGEEATAAGWGVYNIDDYWNPLRPDHLQQVQLDIKTTTSFCQERIGQHPPHSIICAGSGDGKDTCRGDSGGPLMLKDTYGLSYLIGVTSYGPTICGAQDTQGIYTNVYYYLPWIVETMRNASCSAKKTARIHTRRSPTTPSNSPSTPTRRRLIFSGNK